MDQYNSEIILIVKRQIFIISKFIYEKYINLRCKEYAKYIMQKCMKHRKQNISSENRFLFRLHSFDYCIQKNMKLHKNNISIFTINLTILNI